VRQRAGLLWLLLALTALGLLLRVLRLSWQPLWWDEGYSIYFATEPLSHMVWLTAHDIHPPLYYALLHGWLRLLGSAQPEPARAFSVLCGVLAIPALAWLARAMFPGRPAVALGAALLLAINPFHLFYSQEVRMYGQALLLALVATIAFWELLRRLDAGLPPYLPLAAYVAAGALALQTLYYLGFLLAAHQLWGWLHFRRKLSALAWMGGAAAAILLLQLPWWRSALPNLLPYVDDKVLSDQDFPLPLWSYLGRHALAFVGGHIAAPEPWLNWLRYAGLLSLALLPFPFLYARHTTTKQDLTEAGSATALATFLLVPITAGFLVNLRLPFFPDGGERLLLYVLPFLLLWLTWALVVAAERNKRWTLLGIPLALAAAAGIVTYFIVPRYTEHDYRPIIRYVTQHSRAQDTVYAIFPWQIGFWRAYGATSSSGDWLLPQPAPLGQQALAWSQTIEQQLDSALAAGTVWFPAPLSLGSRLPAQIESYLQGQARSLENRWFSSATRLSAWSALPAPPDTIDTPVMFGPVTLVQVATPSEPIPAANEPFAVDLAWSPAPAETLHVALRLRDADNLLWTVRDYEPLGAFTMTIPTAGGADNLAANDNNSGNNSDNISDNHIVTDSLAVLMPAGLPPGEYQLLVGVGPQGSDTLFATTGAGQPTSLAPVATISVTTPAQPLEVARLAMDNPLPQPWQDRGLSLLGHSGAPAGSRWLAGTVISPLLFLRSDSLGPADRELTLSLLDRSGAGVAGWQGWPLPAYPPSTWTEGALVQMPATLQLPATLAPGRYTLAAGLTSPDGGSPLPPAELAEVEITRRPASFTPLDSSFPLTEPVQFGAHALLQGYDIEQTDNIVHLTLDWQILQSLLPAHHLFVHVLTPDGTLLAQADGEPISAAGPAPTGSWLPGEYLRTSVPLTLPTELPASLPGLTLSVGLYEPISQVRLPTSQAGQPTGDAAQLSFAP
jgi:uncharacterized membrane protein